MSLAYRYSTAGGPLFSEAMAVHVNDYLKPHDPVKPEQIITTAGLTPMHNLLAHSLADPGDGFLVSRPIYGRFELDFGNVAEVKVVYADQNGIDPFEISIVDCFERKIIQSTQNGIRIRAVWIVNPNNPLGMDD